MPSTFGNESDWLTCETLLAQGLVFYRVLPFAIDYYANEFVAFLFSHVDFYVGILSFAVFDAEV